MLDTPLRKEGKTGIVPRTYALLSDECKECGLIDFQYNYSIEVKVF